MIEEIENYSELSDWFTDLAGLYVSPEEAGYILWNETCYPFGTATQVETQAKNFFDGVAFDYAGIYG